LLQADLEVRILARIQVIIDLPPYPKHQSPVIDAYVARRHKHGIGIEWCQFAPAAVSELLRAAVRRPYVHIQRRAATASLTTRLSAPLLKHGA
jgi:hypothetical protein